MGAEPVRRAIQGAVSAFALAAAMFSGTVVAAAAPAGAAAASVPDSTIGQKILDSAETRRGYWYVYGDAGPSYFDCSGLVYWAARQRGVSLPRTTYGMLGSSLLERVYNPERGDLAFYGSGHVEFVTVYHDTTFGAQRSGTRIGWHVWSGTWHPTMYFRIR